jgi:lipid-binding SYLF domain-containing protein
MKKNRGVSRTVVLLLIGILVAGLVDMATPKIAGADTVKQQALVDKARITFESFMADSNMAWLRNHIKNAKGLLILPELLKGAFIFGGEGGSGVLLVPDPETGKWSEPAFYTIGSVSWGLQIGGQKAEVIMLVRTRKGLESLYTSSFKLGGDVSVAAGPVGTGAEAGTAPSLKADYLSFARTKGAFIGISLEGAVIKTKDKWNNAYYGKPVRPGDIIVTREVSNPKSAELRGAVAKASK